jgi:hypothetical protein
LAALGTLSMGRSLDSMNLDLEVLSQIDLSALGTPNLDKYQATYNLTVDSSCRYRLEIAFKKHADDQPGDASPEFAGVCAESDSTGNAPDGKPWHAPRRNWMQFPPYVYDTTGFDHMSIYWRPCGLPPRGLRLSRFDLTFYTVLPQYRAFWTCAEGSRTPKVCSPNQTSTFGRAQFVVPRLERDPTFLANLPVGFNPDPLVPEAYQHEGLFHWSDEQIPPTTAEYRLPQFDLSTYDGDVVAFRTMLPYRRFSGSNRTSSTESQFYVYQTMPKLPGSWNTVYDPVSGLITVILAGSAGICGESFDAVKIDQEEAAATRRLRG